MICFFNDTATTEIYTLSLHDALPIFAEASMTLSRSLDLETTVAEVGRLLVPRFADWCAVQDRKSTRLNSSHANISYAVFCLKKEFECGCCMPLLRLTTFSCVPSLSSA